MYRRCIADLKKWMGGEFDPEKRTAAGRQSVEQESSFTRPKRVTRKPARYGEVSKVSSTASSLLQTEEGNVEL